MKYQGDIEEYNISNPYTIITYLKYVFSLYLSAYLNRSINVNSRDTVNSKKDWSTLSWKILSFTKM